MQVGERTQRHAPAFVAVLPVGDQAEVTEEGIDRLAVGYRSGRGRAVEFVQQFRAVPVRSPGATRLVRCPGSGRS